MKELERMRAEVEKLRADVVAIKEQLRFTEVAAECLQEKVRLLREMLREANHGR